MPTKLGCADARDGEPDLEPRADLVQFLLHARQLLGSMRERLAGLEPSGPTNFDALGAASLDWRNQGALVVVLTDLLFDVDDDRMNDAAPQDLPQLPLTTTERALLNGVRAQARRRLMLSAQNVARGLGGARADSEDEDFGTRLRRLGSSEA